MTMLGPCWRGGSSGADSWLVGKVGAGAGGCEPAASCCQFWSVGGQGRLRLIFFALAWAGLEVVGLGGREVG